MIRKTIVIVASMCVPMLLSAEPRGSVTPHWTLPTEPAVAWDSGDYTYDHNGNIVKIGKDTFAYDGVNRLTASTVTAYGVSTSQKFEYDRYGNLTVADGTASNGAACRETLAVQPTTNRLTQTCECGVCQTWTFDEAGNQTALGTALTYRWDAAGSMTELKGPVAHERYVYDANDERVLLVSLDQNHEVVRRWTWRDASNKVAREAVEHVGSDVWTESRDYVYRNGTLLASFESPDAAVAERHYHVDHLGTPRLITDNARRKLAVETYMPFGGRALGSDASYIGFQDRMRFTGHERDGEGSAYRPALDYMHARYYTPDWGRFVSVDPTWESADLNKPQSWNRYSYVRNNPMNRTDPTGKVDLGQFLYGAASALATDLWGGYGRPPATSADMAAGQFAGDLAALATGTQEITGGVTTALTGGTVTVSTGGVTTPITVPAAAAGTVVAVHGALVVKTAVSNLIQSGSQMSRTTPQIGRGRPGTREQYHNPPNKPLRQGAPDDPKQPKQPELVKKEDRHNLLDKLGDILGSVFNIQ